MIFTEVYPLNLEKKYAHIMAFQILAACEAFISSGTTWSFQLNLIQFILIIIINKGQYFFRKLKDVMKMHVGLIKNFSKFTD